jgi:hypothetical protein
MIQISPSNRVSLIGCRPGILSALPVLEAECERLGLSLLVTSGSDGKHGEGSLHPAPHGLALDYTGVKPSGMLASITELQSMAAEVRARLGRAFDVTEEIPPDRPSRNHIHVERDPKKRPLEFWEEGA